MMGKRYLWFPAIFLLAAVCLYCGENKGGGPGGGAALFAVELEHYSSSHDEEASQIPIRTEHCPNAGNDSSATGLDIAGEWIIVTVDVPEDGAYEAHLSYASDAGDVVTARLEMDDCGSATTSDFLLTQGTGTS